MKRIDRKQKELVDIKIVDLVQKRDDGIYVSFKNLHDIAQRFTEQEGFSLARKFIQVFDVDENPVKSNRDCARGLKTDIEQIISESDEPIKCEACGNQEDFSVFVSEFYLTLENGRKIKSLYVEHEEVITKPDTVVIICRNCGKVVVESSVC